MFNVSGFLDCVTEMSSTCCKLVKGRYMMAFQLEEDSKHLLVE
jgi:hypothetical protein